LRNRPSTATLTDAAPSVANLGPGGVIVIVIVTVIVTVTVIVIVIVITTVIAITIVIVAHLHAGMTTLTAGHRLAPSSLHRPWSASRSHSSPGRLMHL